MTNDLRILSIIKYLCPIGYILLGSLYSFQVSAKGNLDLVTQGTISKVIYNPSSLPTDTKINFTPSGQPYLSSSKAYTIQGAKAPITLALKQPITKAAAARAMTGLLRSSPLGLAITAGGAMYDYFSSQDMQNARMGQDANGNPVLQYQTTSPTMDCFLNGTSTCKTLDPNSVTYVADGICYGKPYESYPYFYQYGTCQMRESGGTMEDKSMTLPELEQKIASESGWPSSSYTSGGKTINPPTIDSPIGKALSKALQDPQTQVQPSVETETSPAPSITGPSSVAGITKTSTSVSPEGKQITTTQTTNYNITYAGDTINVTERTTNVVNNGDTITTTTTEADKELPPEKEPTKDICEKNPDAFMCQKIDLDTPTGEIPKVQKTITFQTQNLGFGGGSCPSNSQMTLKGVGNVTLFDWQKTCNMVTTYVKPMFILMATFAALMIVFVGGTNKDSI